MYDVSSPFRVEKYEYDNNNKLIKTTAYNRDNTIFYYETYELDSNSRRTSIKQYRDNSLRVTWEFIYDTVGNLIEEKYTDLLEPTLSTWQKNIYNDKGLIIKSTGTLSGNAHVYTREYEYSYFD